MNLVKMLRSLSTIALVLLLQSGFNAQGCSDAGVCTSGATQPETSRDSVGSAASIHDLSYIQLVPSSGIGEKGTLISSINSELQLRINKMWFSQIKIPYTLTAGDLGFTYGTGDVTANVICHKTISKSDDLIMSGGFKIPIGKTNLQANGLPLPMPYQTGLGTWDALFGIAWTHKLWRFSAGVQWVLSNNNDNGFLHSRWPSEDKALAYFESNNLKRGNDALIRIDKLFTLYKLRMTAGVVVIYRIKGDYFTNSSGIIQRINGSDGFTINITASGNYRFSWQWEILSSVGAPAKVRHARPDGLTRAAVINVGIRYYFKNNFK